jgi:hypothetical protein
VAKFTFLHCAVAPHPQQLNGQQNAPLQFPVAQSELSAQAHQCPLAEPRRASAFGRKSEYSNG